VDWKLEVVTIPVSDMDRAKTFYAEQIGFNVDIDHQVGRRATCPSRSISEQNPFAS
jgi:predicted enzyme related to lactoylglutathione lyase